MTVFEWLTVDIFSQLKCHLIRESPDHTIIKFHSFILCNFLVFIFLTCTSQPCQSMSNMIMFSQWPCLFGMPHFDGLLPINGNPTLVIIKTSIASKFWIQDSFSPTTDFLPAHLKIATKKWFYIITSNRLILPLLTIHQLTLVLSSFGLGTRFCWCVHTLQVYWNHAPLSVMI